jgi:hypothetical protein
MISAFQSHEFGFGMHLCVLMKRQQWKRDNTTKNERSPAVHSSKNLSMANLCSYSIIPVDMTRREAMGW